MTMERPTPTTARNADLCEKLSHLEELIAGLEHDLSIVPGDGVLLRRLAALLSDQDSLYRQVQNNTRIPRHSPELDRTIRRRLDLEASRHA
jgi:hypothetical protein